MVNLNNPYWGGVDLFFCISGFVISKNLIREWPYRSIQSYWSQVWRFWVRRFFRIVPTLAVWLLIFLLASRFFNHSENFGPIKPNLNDAKAALLNYSNFHIYQCVIGKSECGPNPVFWSLSLEEQFYLALPLLLLLPRRAVGIIVIVLIISQLPINRLPWQPGVAGALWFVRTDAILLGVLLAYLSSTNWHTKATFTLDRFRPWLRLSTIPFVVGLMLVPRSGMSVAAGGIALISTGLVFLASFDRQYLAPQGRLLTPLVWIGSRSFSIYLIHIPVFYIVTEIFFRRSSNGGIYKYPISDHPYHPYMALLTISLILLISELNYRWIETPLRKIGRDVTEKGLYSPSTVSPNR